MPLVISNVHLALPSKARDRLRPTRLGPEAFGGLPVVLVACGGAHTMALTGGGCVWTCGINDCGQLGHGDRTGKHLFTRVDPGHFGRARIVMAACGAFHNVVASAAGDVFTWGGGLDGCLGHNDVQGRLAPARLGREQFGGAKIVFVAAGGLLVGCLGHNDGLCTRSTLPPRKLHA